MWIISDYHNFLLIICGIFYSILCIFSIVTGLMYASGKRKLNPLELSDKVVNKLDNDEKKMTFTKTMGWVTFIVGLVQGLTAFSLFKGHSGILYGIAIGFTIFSILSAGFKLKTKFNLFPLLKIICYIGILVILLLPSSISLFF